MADIQKLIRRHLLQLKPYSSARDEYTGWEGVFLDANENALGTVGGGDYNRYPDPYQSAIKAELQSIKHVDPANIFLGNGSDEAIDLLYRAFCEPGEDEVLLLPPTYGMYEVSANINHIRTKTVSLTSDYQLNLPAIREAVTGQTKMIFVCSPNNPSGNCMRREDIVALLDLAPGLVIVDEAYIDFCPENTLLPLLAEYPNLVLLQTFSKAWGMANLRLGMAFAHREVIEILNRIKPPYNVNGLTQQLALKALQNRVEKEEMVAEILRQREYLERELAKLELVEHIYPSDANFLLVKVAGANQLYQDLIEEKVIVRNRSRVILCDECLRITVGTVEENLRLLAALTQISNR